MSLARLFKRFLEALAGFVLRRIHKSLHDPFVLPRLASLLMPFLPSYFNAKMRILVNGLGSGMLRGYVFFHRPTMQFAAGWSTSGPPFDPFFYLQ